MPSVSIDLDEKTRSYLPGAKIKGKVELRLEMAAKIKPKIAAIGMENCSAFDNYENDVRSYDSFIDYLVINVEEKIAHPTSKKTSFEEVDGVHHYPFHLRLPVRIPQTFQRKKLGFISYYLQATVKITCPGEQVRTERHMEEIYILPTDIDIRYFPQKYFNRYINKTEDAICCVFCQRGSVRLELDFPKRVYCRDETISFSISVMNLSNKTIHKVYVNGYGRVYFREEPEHDFWKSGDVNNLKFSKVVSAIKVPGRGRKTWEVELETPTGDLLNFQGSHLFEFGYDLEVVVDMGWRQTLQDVVHIKIGDKGLKV